jgi:hypothetical protein
VPPISSASFWLIAKPSPARASTGNSYERLARIRRLVALSSTTRMRHNPRPACRSAGTSSATRHCHPCYSPLECCTTGLIATLEKSLGCRGTVTSFAQ